MNFKRILLITLLLAVLTIGAVSAADDADALAVDDTGDEQVIESPVDENEVETSVVDEDALEAEENTDTLASPYANFGDEIYSDYHTVVSIHDHSDGINGIVTLFANDTMVYNQEVVEDDSFYLYPGDLTGSFYGTYNMKVVYNSTGGTNFEQTGTVTFTKLFKNLAPEDFNVTFTGAEVDLDKGGVILTYCWPEGLKEHLSQIEVRYGEGEFERQIFSWDPDTYQVNTYKNVTCWNLYIKDEGVYNISVYYDEYFAHVFPLGNITITVVNNHVYTADDIIFIYDDYLISDPEDCIADIYDGEIKGLDGTVTAYADGVQIYTKTHTNNGRGGPIHAKDVTGYFHGEYDIKIVYERSDGKVFSLNKTVAFYNLSVGEQMATSIAASSISTVYNVNKYLVATLKDSNGKPISDVDVYVDIMGVSFPLKTDKNGQIKQPVSSLPPKKSHTVTFTFKDTAIYKGSTKKVTVTVAKATPKITAKAKTFKKSVKTKKYTITLKNNVNKPISGVKVTIKVNKKTFSAKTNSKGQATFKITKLTKKGKYTATVKYAGNSYYNAKSVKAKITVK